MRFCLIILCLTSMMLGCTDPKFQKESYFLRSKKEVDEYLPRISRSTVKNLDIENANLDEDDLSIIGSFRQLEYLQFYKCDIEDNDLQYFSELENLERLDISSPKVSDEGLKHFAKLIHLKSLRLSCKNITGSGFSSLAHLQSIQSLDLNGCAIDDNGMLCISKFDKLNCLWLAHAPATDNGLDHVRHNYWLLNVTPSDKMTIEGLRVFREQLLKGRRQARESGKIVPPDDTLFIQSNDPKIRGAMPVPGYSKRINELLKLSQ